MTLPHTVRRFIEEQGMLSPGERVLVAVSGGPDSVALLRILYDLRQELNLHLEVAHLQHGIRGQEAEDDARFVQALAERLDLPLHIKEVSIPRMRSQAGKGNIEALARRERYAFFSEVGRRQNLDKIATAHTQDDQAETVLMWLLRGAGRKGLGGMAPIQTIHLDSVESSKALKIIRPLAGVGKQEVMRFVDQRGLEYRFDRSNEDSAYLRNWIRLELLPRIKDRLDPGVPARLARLAEVLRDEEVLLNALARTELESLSADSALRRDGFLRQPRALQRRILRLWIEGLRGDLRAVDFDHVEALRRLVAEGAPHARLSIPGGWEFIREYDVLRLVRKGRCRAVRDYAYPVVIGGTLTVPEADMAIDCRVASAPVDLPHNCWEAVFDRTALTGPLIVRNFRRGDRFQPLGMTGHKKVKDLFIEKKAAPTTRALLPLLVMGREVLWLPGYGRSEVGRVDAQSKEVLCLRAFSSVN